MGRWGFASCVSGGPARRKSRPAPWKSPPARLKPSSSAIWKRPPGCAEIPPWPWRCCSGGTVRVVRILGIESSCDETAAAVVENGEAVLSSVVASQMDTHSKYGGVVPELASREHLRAIAPVVREALGRSKAGERLQGE